MPETVERGRSRDILYMASQLQPKDVVRVVTEGGNYLFIIAKSDSKRRARFVYHDSAFEKKLGMQFVDVNVLGAVSQTGELIEGVIAKDRRLRFYYKRDNVEHRIELSPVQYFDVYR